MIEALSDDLNTAGAIAVLRSNYRAARNGGFEEKRQFLMDCQFLGLLRHDKLWVHLQGVMGRNTRGLSVPHEIVRKLRISVANNLPSLRQESERALSNLGLGAEVAKDGNVTLIPLTQAAKDSEKNIEDLILRRNAARARKDFKESDRIRDELATMKIVLKDGKDAEGNPVTTWDVAR